MRPCVVSVVKLGASLLILSAMSHLQIVHRVARFRVSVYALSSRRRVLQVAVVLEIGGKDSTEFPFWLGRPRACGRTPGTRGPDRRDWRRDRRSASERFNLEVKRLGCHGCTEPYRVA